MLIVYEHPLSPYAQKVKIALREKEVPFEVMTPDAIGSGDTASSFLEANPRGEVPVLIDDGFAIFDSTIMLEYIEDKWPSPSLLPTSPQARAQMRMLEDVCDTQYEAINWGLGEISWFKRAEGPLADTLLANAAEQTRKLNTWLERQLGGKPWFNGEQFGWGDLAVAPYVRGASSFGNGPEDGSKLADWFARTSARETVSTTFQEADASVAGMQVVADVLKQGLFKREYRDHRLEWMIKSGGISVVTSGLADNNIRFSNDFE